MKRNIYRFYYGYLAFFVLSHALYHVLYSGEMPATMLEKPIDTAINKTQKVLETAQKQFESMKTLQKDASEKLWGIQEQERIFLADLQENMWNAWTRKSVLELQLAQLEGIKQMKESFEDKNLQELTTRLNAVQTVLEAFDQKLADYGRQLTDAFQKPRVSKTQQTQQQFPYIDVFTDSKNYFKRIDYFLTEMNDQYRQLDALIKQVKNQELAIDVSKEQTALQGINEGMNELEYRVIIMHDLLNKRADLAKHLQTSKGVKKEEIRQKLFEVNDLIRQKATIIDAIINEYRSYRVKLRGYRNKLRGQLGTGDRPKESSVTVKSGEGM